MKDNDREKWGREGGRGHLGRRGPRRKQKEKDRQTPRDRAPYTPGGAGRDLEESQGGEGGERGSAGRRTGDRETWAGGVGVGPRGQEKRRSRERGPSVEMEGSAEIHRGQGHRSQGRQRRETVWGWGGGMWEPRKARGEGMATGRQKLRGSAQPATPRPPSCCIT